MKVGISILLFGVVLMFWTGASGEQNFFRKEKPCYRQPEGNFSVLSYAMAEAAKGNPSSDLFYYV